MAKTHAQREFEALLKKEMENMKREERLENVARIGRANQYAAD